MEKTIIFVVNYLGQGGRGFGRKVTRKLELKETQTLDDLHEAIIYQSFKWDGPHLYSFHFDNKPYSKNRRMEFTCDDHINLEPELGNNPNSTNTHLKTLKLKKNQEFLFIFDFGDDHFLKIKVSGFGNVQESKKYPWILEEKGKAPKQYLNY